jgi:mxaJ protein
MSSRFRRGAASGVAGLLLCGVLAFAWKADPPLRVCADPNNLPFSNRQGQGFENHIATLLAKDLHRRLEYEWAPQWRGFIRKTLDAGACDVVLGIPAESDRLRTTEPYYSSTYVFLSRRDRGLRVRSFDDPALRHARIGIHFVGDDYANPPPAYALGRRHLADRVVGYSLMAGYDKSDPPAELVHAVARGDVDVAVVWGPLAGYYAAREATPLELAPVTPAVDSGGLRFTFDIAAGVRREDSTLAARLDQSLRRHRSEIDSILRAYHVPLVHPGCAESKEGSCG